MIKWFVVLFVALIAAIWLGVQMHGDPGYVLISYHSWTIEMTLWLFLSALLLLVVVLSLLSWLLNSIDKISLHAHYWIEMRRFYRTSKNHNDGLRKLAEGRWCAAEKKLVRAAKNSETSFLNYLAAARAAQHQKRYDARDEYLRKAHLSAPDAEIAVGLTQAQLQLNAGQFEQSLATLRHLQSLAPKHVYVLSLLQEVCLKLHDWNNIKELLPRLAKYHVITDDKLAALSRQTYSELLLSKQNESLRAINKFWKTIPRHMRKDAIVLQKYNSLLVEKKRITHQKCQS